MLCISRLFVICDSCAIHVLSPDLTPSHALKSASSAHRNSSKLSTPVRYRKVPRDPESSPKSSMSPKAKQDLRASGGERKVRKGGQGRETLYRKASLRQRFFVVGSGGHQYGCKEKRKKWEVYSRKEQQT